MQDGIIPGIIFAHIQVGFCVLLSYQNSLCILDTNPLTDIGFANVFLQSVVCLFIYIMASF